jgi:hypothetical protein
MNRTSCLRLSRLALPVLLAALVSSACAQQSTKGDSKTVPFQVTFEPNGAVIVKTPEGKRLEPVPAKFPFTFPEKTAGVQMYNFNAFRFAGSSYMIFCMGPGYCFCFDLPEPPDGHIGNACSTLH